MRLHEGDPVTVEPVESDPYILNFQTHATVSRLVDGGYLLHLDAAWPPDAEFGPIPPERLSLGWKDNSGRWR